MIATGAVQIPNEVVDDAAVIQQLVDDAVRKFCASEGVTVAEPPTWQVIQRAVVNGRPLPHRLDDGTEVDVDASVVTFRFDAVAA